MAAQSLRLAVVGAGLIAKNSHVPSALGCVRAKLTAIVDPAEHRAKEIATDYGLEVRIAADVGAVLNDVDAAIICTPNHTHAPIAVACLEAGKHVLIDKPMATSVKEGEAILAAAASTGTKVAVGYATRFRENIELMKELLDNGTFGQVRSFINRFGTSGGWSPKSGYILDKKTSGGGVLVVSGTHFLDRMLLWFGYPDYADLESDAAGGPEANCRAHFRYSNDGTDFHGSAVYSKTTALPAGTVIDTEQGYLILGEFDSSEILFRPHHSPGIEHVVRRRGPPVFPAGQSSFDLQMDDFVSACLDDHPPRVDGVQGQNSMRLIQQLYGQSKPLGSSWYDQTERQIG